MRMNPSIPDSSGFAALKRALARRDPESTASLIASCEVLTKDLINEAGAPGGDPKDQALSRIETQLQVIAAAPAELLERDEIEAALAAAEEEMKGEADPILQALRELRWRGEMAS